LDPETAYPSVLSENRGVSTFIDNLSSRKSRHALSDDFFKEQKHATLGKWLR
jgi:hypothetical protein